MGGGALQALVIVYLGCDCWSSAHYGQVEETADSSVVVQGPFKRKSTHPFPTHLPTLAGVCPSPLGGVCPSPENSSLSLNTEALREQVSNDGAFQYQYKLSSV